LGGVFCYGGAFAAKVEWDQIDIDAKKAVPLFIYHGEEDPIFPAEYAKLSYKNLTDNGLDHMIFEVKDHLLHSMLTCLPVLQDFCEYLMVPVAPVEYIEESKNGEKIVNSEDEEAHLEGRFGEKDADEVDNQMNKALYTKSGAAQIV
jgi:predicted peptidase